MAFKTYIPGGGGGSFDPSVDTFMNDDKKFGYGTSEDYSIAYNTTNTALELTSSTAGKILWVDDGTNDVNFSGGLKLNGGEKLILDADADANNYITAADTSMNFYVEGALYFRLLNNRVYGDLGFQAPSNAKIYIGGTSTTDAYWQVYNSTGTAFELWSTNVDGSNTDGKVFWVDDGTDDVNFSGGLNLKFNEKIVFDADVDSTEYITSSTYGRTWVNASAAVIFSIGGATQCFAKSSGFAVPQNKRLVLDNAGGTDQYWSIYNSTGTAYELWSTNVDGSNTDGKVFWVDDGTDDVNFSGTLFLKPDGVESINFGANTKLKTYAGGGRITVVYNNNDHGFFGGATAILMRANDDKRIDLGSGGDYWQVYNSTGTAFELWSTNVDGSNTDGKVFWVDDGTDDVHFSGNLEVLGQAYGKVPVLQPTGSNPSQEIDFDTGNSQILLLASASLAVSASLDNLRPGASYIVRVEQNPGAAIDVNWSSASGSVFWENGSTPTVTTTLAGSDIFSFWFDGSNLYGTQGSNFS